MGTTLIEKILFELPVYRVSKAKYNNEYQKFYKKRKTPCFDPLREEKVNSALCKTYGGDWEYNDIVGYLKFHKFGNDIRCAYYKGYNKKAVRNGKRSFEIVDDSILKITINKSYQNNQIIKEVKEIIKSCKAMDEFKNRFIDTKAFDNMVNFIDWQKYLFSK